MVTCQPSGLVRISCGTAATRENWLSLCVSSGYAGTLCRLGKGQTMSRRSVIVLRGGSVWLRPWVCSWVRREPPWPVRRNERAGRPGRCGSRSAPVTLTPAGFAATTACGAGVPTGMVGSGSGTRQIGTCPTASGPTPTGHSSEPAHGTPAGSVPTTLCGVGAPTTPGQLGLGDTAPRWKPTIVGSGIHWRQVSLAHASTCATQTDGTLWCWGYNVYGQLGQGDFTDRHTPTRVGTDTDWAQVSTDFSHGHACATRSDNTLWCWGLNEYGQLGLGDTVQRSVPTQVGIGTTWSQVSTGHYYTCALRNVHSLFCWGYNSTGQLGVGDYVSHTLSTRV